MKKAIWINGEEIKMEIDPEAILQEIVQQAISLMEDKRYTTDDFFCISGSDDFLDPKRKLSDQDINLENKPIYVVHRSKRHWFTKQNPYSGSDRSIFS